MNRLACTNEARSLYHVPQKGRKRKLANPKPFERRGDSLKNLVPLQNSR